MRKGAPGEHFLRGKKLDQERKFEQPIWKEAHLQLFFAFETTVCQF